VEKATLSLGYKRQAKVVFRRAQSNSERKFYEEAIKDLEEALSLLSDSAEDLKTQQTIK